jgi:hypothetical protein
LGEWPFYSSREEMFSWIGESKKRCKICGKIFGAGPATGKTTHLINDHFRKFYPNVDDVYFEDV